MNQFITPILYTIGSAYIARKTSDYIVGAVINKTTDIIVDTATSVLRNKPVEKEADVLFEYIDENTINTDNILYVTGTYSESEWDKISTDEIDIINHKEKRRKERIKPIMPSPIYTAITNEILIKKLSQSSNNGPFSPVSSESSIKSPVNSIKSPVNSISPISPEISNNYMPKLTL